MDQADQACVDDVRYQVTPYRTYEDESGRFCREYVTTAIIDGRVEEVRDTACRQPDGGWRRVD